MILFFHVSYTMELTDEINPQEYDQLMDIMDKKDWKSLKENIHKPEILQVLPVYADAMTQRKHAQIQLTQTHVCSWDRKPQHILEIEQTALRECISHNAAIEQEQLKILTKMLYGKERTYDDLHLMKDIKYLCE